MTDFLSYICFGTNKTGEKKEEDGRRASLVTGRRASPAEPPLATAIRGRSPRAPASPLPRGAPLCLLDPSTADSYSGRFTVSCLDRKFFEIKEHISGFPFLSLNTTAYHSRMY